MTPNIWLFLTVLTGTVGIIIMMIILTKKNWKPKLTRNSFEIKDGANINMPNGMICISQNERSLLVEESEKIGTQKAKAEKEILSMQLSYSARAGDNMKMDMLNTVCQRYGWTPGDPLYNEMKMLLGHGAFLGHMEIREVFIKNHFTTMEGKPWVDYKSRVKKQIFPKVQDEMLSYYNDNFLGITKEDFIIDNIDDFQEICHDAISDMLDQAKEIAHEKEKEIASYEAKKNNLKYSNIKEVKI